MASLPKPLIGLLLGTVAFFAIWMVALKPSSSSPGGSPNGVGQYQSAINAAHGAVTTSGQANAKLGAPTATAPARQPATPAKPATPATPTHAEPVTAAHVAKSAKPVGTSTKPVGTSAKPAHVGTTAKPATSAPTAAQGVKTLQSAIAAHKVIAVLFYNPAASDDQAMKRELAAVPTHHGEVVTLAVPVSELTYFQAVTAQVPVVTAPTLIVIDHARQASTLTGFASQLELNQRVADALAAK